MLKKRLGPTTNLFPMPALLVAVRTGEREANILTVAWAGVVGGSPPMLALEIGQSHFSTPHIDREGSISVNVPSADQAVGTDYCGMVSGRKDSAKADTCGWTLVPADKISAPLVAECPLNFECEIVRKVASGEETFYLVEVVETHVDEQVLSDEGKPDARKLDPLIFTPDGYYHRLGERMGKAWSIGAQLQ